MLFSRRCAVRGGAIRVRRVVVVGVASRVHIPHVVRVAAIGRTQPDVLSTAYIPVVLKS